MLATGLYSIYTLYRQSLKHSSIHVTERVYATESLNSTLIVAHIYEHSQTLLSTNLGPTCFFLGRLSTENVTEIE